MGLMLRRERYGGGVQGNLALPLLLLTAQQRSIIASTPLDDEAEVPEQLKTTAENYDRCQEVLGQVLAAPCCSCVSRLDRFPPLTARGFAPSLGDCYRHCAL